ncbi:hypothetical protein SH668x_001398 [Planctomicrobium sp. SH668]|uniref:hypothetical protein n=1 Tax=Planctomicrobium sp. SH668 TaxID=3448126 RepID=UPI003F5B26C9
MPVGLHVMSDEDAQLRIGQGGQFIAMGSDFSLLATEATHVVNMLGISASTAPLVIILRDDRSSVTPKQ